ncbi:hypothetical protein L208DRAFT_1554721 [Tricholoma matsutake]|nr:hypothetical protein L208DRAFT_1554721 [Tricholoma matsutake 945]
MTSFAASSVSVAQKQQLKCLRAVCALLYIHRQTPMPLSPAVILFIVYKFNLHCLTPGFIGEWFINLRKLIADWLELGPEGNLQPFASHFATYHDTEVSAYRNHDFAIHQSIAVDMLYKATLGSNLYWLPEWTSFTEGFDLPCQNGFWFTEARRCLHGGPEAFLSLNGVSFILGFDSLNGHLSIMLGTEHQQLMNICCATGNPSLTYESLLHNFLQGQGIPCPQQFADLASSFSNLIDLLLIDSPAFQSCMLVWAATGSPLLDVTAEPISASQTQLTTFTLLI